MNSLRSVLRQSISLGTNPFQDKDKLNETSAHGGSKDSGDVNITDFDNDNDIFQEVVENEQLDPATGTWKPCDSDMTK